MKTLRPVIIQNMGYVYKKKQHIQTRQKNPKKLQENGIEAIKPSSIPYKIRSDQLHVF